MRPLLYYITDRRQFPGGENEQERRLLAKIAECAAAEVDFIQLREKDLSARRLEALALSAMAVLGQSRTRLLINSRMDVAVASGAHGVHLPANHLSASEARSVFSRASVTTSFIAVSVHSLAEIASAESHGADFAVFAPVFEKNGAANPSGLEELKQICHRPAPAAPPMPVVALGGITLENARLCLKAGAAGIAAIRLFQETEVRQIVPALRNL